METFEIVLLVGFIVFYGAFLVFNIMFEIKDDPKKNKNRTDTDKELKLLQKRVKVQENIIENYQSLVEVYEKLLVCLSSEKDKDIKK